MLEVVATAGPHGNPIKKLQNIIQHVSFLSYNIF
jgi:hypothetical protein